MLTSTLLVILMTIPGLALFYGGLGRSKNMLSVLMQVFVIFSLISILWAVYGYSIAFDTTGMEQGVINFNSFFGSLNKAFLAALPKAGPQVVASAEVGGKDEVSADTAAQIKAGNVDVVVLFAREPQLQSLLGALQKVGHTNVVVLGTNVIRNKNVATQPIPVKALYATATAIDASEFANGAKFLGAFQAKYGSAPVWGAHYAYDAVYALADAAKRSPSVKSADLLATLKRIDPSTRVLQNMRFTESGEQRYPNIGVYKVERGAWAPQLVSASW
jgi:ABC-type branched-subunit amino acid transport system substrate-binding protein